jgi:enoyl-CoA hydratase/carnithine racemase
MTTDPVLFEAEGPLGILTLNRPAKHNAVNEAVMVRLESLLDQIEAEREIRALILTGAGDRTFCAGGDLQYFAGLKTREEGEAMSRRMQAILRRLYQGERVVIAAVNGQALGGGCEILTACHLRVAGETAGFAFRQAANGITTGWGGGVRLFRLLGRSKALDLLLTSRMIEASEALALGLIDRVVPPDQALPEARKLAQQICANPARAVRAFLELARVVDQGDSEAAVRRETELFGEGWESEEFGRVLARFGKSR